MGRKLLAVENQSIHPILSLSLLIACMAAIVAFISSLCVSRKKPMPTTSQPKATEDVDVVTASPNEATTTETTIAEATMEPPSVALVESDNTKEPQLPLPPPPGMPHFKGSASYHHRSSSSASSERKLLSSMSLRVQGLGGMRQPSKREETSHEKKRDKKLKHEDSVWKKTIILGERCRVPDEDDDTVVFDEKGNRISTYHPKMPSSLPVSRQTSSIDPDAIPSSG
ncbi:hypothetical protein RHMOL_Rhmol11G0096800 [Rhododendron molle]|uniref:Uncharacterized protein n=1 Tax=Rhododendron molle TaxID=49168 RepID=A0ACC0LQK0_RHOML|nr:hypothetical protein RHMOL_Rhmol11G0096800 [Rhododendron molle]